jgi:hypothetical protein
MSPNCRSFCGSGSDVGALIRIAPSVPSVRVWSGWWLVLRVWLTKAAEPACGVHALLNCCEAAICAAATHPTAVNRAPRIVLSFAGSDEDGCCSDNAERDHRSHRSPIAGLGIGSTIKSWPVGTLIWVKVELSLPTRRFEPCLLAASRRPGLPLAVSRRVCAARIRLETAWATRGQLHLNLLAGDGSPDFGKWAVQDPADPAPLTIKPR